MPVHCVCCCLRRCQRGSRARYHYAVQQYLQSEPLYTSTAKRSADSLHLWHASSATTNTLRCLGDHCWSDTLTSFVCLSFYLPPIARLRRTAVFGGAVKRFAPQPLARCSNPRRGLASCLLQSGSSGESSIARSAPTSTPPRAAQKLLPRASCRQLSSSPTHQGGHIAGGEGGPPEQAESDKRSKNGGEIR